MNTDTTAPELITSTPAQTSETAKPAVIDDDLDFSDVQLGQRQESATREIVCEGGCE
jgi:hypothetical protein